MLQTVLMFLRPTMLEVTPTNPSLPLAGYGLPVSSTYYQAPFPPTALGLPHASYRAPYQWDAVQRTFDSPYRFVGLCLPTGAGKSAVAMSLAQLFEGRVAILTSTKAHQDQVLREFGDIPGLVDIRGHQSYDCHPVRQLSGQWACKEQRCPYREKRKAASKARIILTNYAFWLTDHLHGKPPVS